MTSGKLPVKIFLTQEVFCSYGTAHIQIGNNYQDDIAYEVEYPKKYLKLPLSIFVFEKTKKK